MDKKKLLWKLFISTFYLSTFTFGGGYVIVTLMKKKFVDDYKWISEKEMLNFVAIAQSAPGAIAVNGAIVVGFKLAGFMGVFVSILGTIIPPFIIISLLSFAYEAFRDNVWISLMLEGMQAGVGAVVTAVSYEMAKDIVNEKDKTLIIMMVIAFLANAVFNVNVMLIILVSILIGLLQSYLAKREGNEN